MPIADFYRRRITVARVYGIPVRIDYRWFVVFAMSAWLIATNLGHGGMWVGQVQLPPVDSATAWILGMITTLGLFISVFGHELSHALMGRAEGIEIEEILLHPFGGLARLRNEPHSPGAAGQQSPGQGLADAAALGSGLDVQLGEFEVARHQV